MAITPEQLAANGSEDGHQAAFFCWCGLNQIKYPQLKWIHAIPNDGHFKRVAQGVRAGVSDIFLPYACFDAVHERTLKYYGLYIELKKPGRLKEKNGGCSDDQLAFMAYAKTTGYKVELCYSWEAARDAVIRYLEGK